MQPNILNWLLIGSSMRIVNQFAPDDECDVTIRYYFNMLQPLRNPNYAYSTKFPFQVAMMNDGPRRIGV